MISEKNQDKIKKICLIALPLLLVLAIVFSVCGFNELKKDNSSAASAVEVAKTNAQDTEIQSKYPVKVALNTKLPELYFTDKNKKKVKLSDYKGKVVVMMYFASYCPYCKKQLAEYNEIKKMADKKGDVALLLVDKLDNKKETAAKAEDYIKSAKLDCNLLFDDKIESYHALGMSLIPTTLLFDKNGCLRYATVDNLSASQLDSMIDYTESCGIGATEKFIENNMTNSNGGIRKNFKNDAGNKNADDVLSESEGLMLLYFSKSGDKANFEKTWGFVKTKMFNNSLAAWSVSKDGKKANANAVIDDLRLVRALDEANKNFGGYENDLKKYADSIYKYNTNNSRLIDFYDFNTKKGAHTLKLCYADFDALDVLAKSKPEFAKVRENAVETVLAGYISDDFPFYCDSYDYFNKNYSDSNLNMAEEMETVLHLAKCGKLPTQTQNYLKRALEDGKLYSGYDIKGNVLLDKKYESTAVYGLVAQTAAAIGDKDLESKALFKMNKMRIFDTTSKFDGAFGKSDGSGIYSFDQIVALLTYKNIGGATNGL